MPGNCPKHGAFKGNYCWFCVKAKQETSELALTTTSTSTTQQARRATLPAMSTSAVAWSSPQDQYQQVSDDDDKPWIPDVVTTQGKRAG